MLCPCYVTTAMRKDIQASEHVWIAQLLMSGQLPFLHYAVWLLIFDHELSALSGVHPALVCAAEYCVRCSGVCYSPCCYEAHAGSGGTGDC